MYSGSRPDIGPPHKADLPGIWTTFSESIFFPIHIMYNLIQKADRFGTRTTLFQSQIIKGLKKRTTPRTKKKHSHSLMAGDMYQLRDKLRGWSISQYYRLEYALLISNLNLPVPCILAIDLYYLGLLPLPHFYICYTIIKNNSFTVLGRIPIMYSM